MLNKILLLIFIVTICYGQKNKLFWDGHNWNRIEKSVDYNEQLVFKIKTAYLVGALDGRLYGYLKTWSKNQEIADNVFEETVDYLSNRELIKNIDYFYKDPLNIYIPVPTAIIISNMYAEQIPIESIENYIGLTRRWINNLTLDLDTLNYSKLLEDKLIKHQKK